MISWIYLQGSSFSAFKWFNVILLEGEQRDNFGQNRVYSCHPNRTDEIRNAKILDGGPLKVVQETHSELT
jgi:hypothetical protein